MAPAIITLLTDFGLADPYVAVMKGVMLKINPQAKLIDITHQIDPGSIIQAAEILLEAYPFFPQATVHLAVIDPGVGSARRPLLVQTGKQFFVGPDNGLFWPLIAQNSAALVIHLNISRYFLPDISRTFHGRDVFAPVAARLSRGENPRKMGSLVDDPVRLSLPAPSQEEHRLVGRIIRRDHFGNLITNIDRNHLQNFLGQDTAVIRIDDKQINGLANTYSDIAKGRLLALIGSSGTVEIAVNGGRASEYLDWAARPLAGLEVEIRRARSANGAKP